MSDDNEVLSRRRVLAMLTGEFAKMAGLTIAGGGAGAVISYVHLNAQATIAARNEIRNAAENTNLQIDERALIGVAKKAYEGEVTKGVVQSTALGAFLGNFLYEPICVTPAPEPDIY